MNILFLGDIVGRSGRDAIAKHLPQIKKDHDIDVTVVSGDNAAHGFGITAKVCDELYDNGVDVITCGDHVWDQREMIAHIAKDQRCLRPLNLMEGTPGRGAVEWTLPDGRKIAVIHVVGRVFMNRNYDCPFRAVDSILQRCTLASHAQAILVDVHCEATSEKVAMGYHCDGRVSAVVGSHTHIPTSDARILPKGTGYLTDAGMCGDYNSVIGMRVDTVLPRFTKDVPGERMSAADQEGTVSGVVYRTDDKTGKTTSVILVRAGGSLPIAEMV